jgi:UDP-2,3-diacylglucosamine hydrolase
VLHGHSHVPTLVRAGAGIYGNAGAWYLDHQYLVIEDTTITRRQWRPSGEHVVLDLAERPTKEAAPQGEEVLRRI